MMSTESALNQMILSVITMSTIYCVIHIFLKHRFPFNYETKTYANLRIVLNYAGQWIANTLVAITATAICYHTIKSSFPEISDFNNEGTATLFIFMIGILICSLNLRALLKFAEFLNQLVLYISLKKNNISNNLKHAIANKDKQAIIENHKLIIQTDTHMKLSKDEIVVLTATLSKYGYHENVKLILDQYLNKEHSLISKFFMNNTNAVEHSVEGLDSSFNPSESFRHKLRNYEHKAINISKVLIVVFVIQILYLLFSNMFYISSTIKYIVPIFTNLIVIIFIFMKHVKLKKLYKKEIGSKNLSTNKIKIRKPLIDNILLGLSVFMIIDNGIGLIF
ncbi:hypothetical protein [Staphylococcus gallinarum]|uniref:hypothetical protein n=1 Tax=Staphylococcus gallinarum TaxID=1293 RepID=UPI001E57B3A9|nr:hypothetical protein [Staphylococcus gallinarum]MCD8845191.1 hypothetical protein [Staphylococcus gallinarum]